MSEKSILVIAPHSDDAELGVGGYLNKQIKDRDANVKIAVLAFNDQSSNRDTGVREDEGRNAARVLQVPEPEFVRCAPDGHFHLVPMNALVAGVEDLLFSQFWDEVFIPLPSFHQDHKVTFDACIAALRPHPKRQFPARVCAYEYPGNVWGPQVPSTGKVYATLRPDNLMAKLAALDEHQSQLVANEKSLWGERGVKALAEMRGAEVETDYAELFYLIRQVLS